MGARKILLGHGSGGRLMHDLIRGLLLNKLNNPVLKDLSDSALLDIKGPLAFTTDSFVVSPLFFPGGDIGKLAVCGTVNDLTVSGASPECLSLSLIIEEGFDYALLEKIVDSISKTAKQAGVKIVTGDLKVVEHQAADKIFINTSGIGRIIKGRKLSVRNICVGDKVIVSGDIARHGLSVLAKRKGLDLGFAINSDCAALNGLLVPILKKTDAIKFMRDPTRGGVATTLNEIAESSGFGIRVEEKCLPVSNKIRAACELLGIDPLYVANEGRVIIIVKKDSAEKVLNLLKKNRLGQGSEVIGSLTKENKGKVILKTSLGTERILDMLSSEPLPRIC
ncbi:MAG: hydrogenase expression/formation protein HypE [Candidatus Omnitrophica bacterium]|nr:hydrogenase expression/formation protein HypE [Candidatus Omnitrophota bacterium]MBU1869379.1 hydrogenase expression/formation protein HypE [Candidatus Omnitrophota bacterium]